VARFEPTCRHADSNVSAYRYAKTSNKHSGPRSTHSDCDSAARLTDADCDLDSRTNVHTDRDAHPHFYPYADRDPQPHARAANQHPGADTDPAANDRGSGKGANRSDGRAVLGKFVCPTGPASDW
jgi:hypothetical protein